MKQVNIKSMNRILVLLFITGVMLQFASCKKADPKPSETEVVKEKLTSSTWTIQNVTVDGVDQTSVYQGLTINFTETTYTTTKGGLVWPASGTWSFTDETATTFKREDGIEVGVEV